MTLPLAGQRAIVTGGAKGFGLGIARALVRRGARVWITGRDRRALDRAAADLGAEAVPADVASPADWDRVFAAAAGAPDILVNNAGAGGPIVPAAQAQDADLLATVQTNLVGAMLGCARAARVMGPRGSGTIVNISSVCDRHAWPGWGAYSAAKAGLLMYSRCLYTELRPRGVRVTCLTPSWGATDFCDASGIAGHDPATASRCIQPDDIGAVVADLCALPAHLCIDQLTLRPLVQDVVPM